jgi:hypothetical protein
MKKKVEPAAASHFSVSKIAEYLDEDPEVVDYYLFRFYGTWGEEKASALLRFVVWAFKNDKEYLIKSTLLHDFELKKDGCSCPQTSGY